jgi:hypothetical protein
VFPSFTLFLIHSSIFLTAEIAEIRASLSVLSDLGGKSLLEIIHPTPNPAT